MLKKRICGIDFSLSLLFPAAMVVMFTLDNSSLPIWCVAASAMHEAGHFFAIYALGQKPHTIHAGIFGVRVIPNPNQSIGYAGQTLISLAGPAVNAISFALIFAAYGWNIPSIVHFGLAAFNLLPVEPLDGGQALYFAMASFCSKKTAERAVMAVSITILAPLSTAGFYLLIKSGYNFTLLAASAYLSLLIVLKRWK